ncbi:PQQ-binding-like beta-propeller repeat protein [Planctomonas sp. JC2975]|uniref:outer membrane protein assembly factor BamB family protein n=1 Tax=Planctomonas sp. JC2975 TaxID=2729626 RepID=UPI001474A36D|nr:PQQ-binding-like beta-propeller repeat protein [Planctomonas sp. JC2975]NNC12497.1 PQQ-binding-like beta-propeller repeat protein [Planctomonas sp. JC2975]
MRPLRVLRVVVAFWALGLLTACGDGGVHISASTPPAAPGAPTSSAAPWPGYHADQARTGSVSGAVADQARQLWKTDLGAAVYGQPVVIDDTVIVGTEENEVVALDRSTGKRLWSFRLGRPLTDVAQRAGCGNIDPLGITSTLAIDVQRREVFAVGEVVGDDGSVHHRLVGLDVGSGRELLHENVDPPLPSGEKTINLLQRVGLALGNGRVYIGYGGNFGDCGTYHGWLVGASETQPGDLVSFQVARDGEGGAIWLSGGAPAIGADGSVYVTTGNANPFPRNLDRFELTESVVKLSPKLDVLASFKDPTASADEDLATGNPVLLPDGLVFAVGKTDAGHLLRASDLSHVATIAGVCGSDPDGGPAYDAATDRLFVPCRDGGIQVIDVAKRKLGNRLPGANGAPIIVGGTVWAATYPGGGLTAYSARSGQRTQHLTTDQLPTFATPSYAGGMLFLGTRTGVVAFG